MVYLTEAPARRLCSLPSVRLTGMGTLVLLRHGESEWNSKGLFTGWVDVGLAPKGAQEAAAAGRMVVDAGLRPDVVHTSVLTRAIQTANVPTIQGNVSFDANGDVKDRTVSVFQIKKDTTKPLDDISAQYHYIGVAPQA